MVILKFWKISLYSSTLKYKVYKSWFGEAIPVSRKWFWGVLDGLKAENGTHHSHEVFFFFFLKRCCFVVVLRRHHLHPSEVVQHPNLAYCHFSKEPVVVDGPIDHLGMPAEQHLPRELGFGTVHLKSATRERRIYSQAAAISSCFLKNILSSAQQSYLYTWSQKKKKT